MIDESMMIAHNLQSNIKRLSMRRELDFRPPGGTKNPLAPAIEERKKAKATSKDRYHFMNRTEGLIYKVKYY